VFGEGIELVAPDGRYLMVGSTFGPPQLALASAIVNRNLTVLGSISAEIGAYYHALQFLDQHRNRFDWNLMFSGHTYSLDEATTAFQRMRSFTEVKAVIEPHRSPP
jgi:D-arabinose 1-dehydrogenase-like Zn-dependent alcohol dehydrogenase